MNSKILLAIIALTNFGTAKAAFEDLPGHSGDVEILSVTGSEGWDADWELHWGYALLNQPPTEKCYTTKSPTNNQAVFSIMLAEVSHVYMLNRGDQFAYLMNGNKVEVCMRSTGICSLCGVAGETPLGAWAKVECTNGPITGDQVKISRQDDGLGFCEVDIRGKQINSRIGILDAIGVDGWDSYWVLEKGYTKAGELPVPNTCYCSKYPMETYAFLKIPLSEVSEVKLLNRDDEWGPISMPGTTVSVCNDDGSCSECAVAPYPAPQAAWISFFCAKGPLTGSAIKVTGKDSGLAFCEVEIIGKLLAPACSHCDDYHRFCPALHDPGFATKYQEILSAGNLKPDFNIRVVPEPVNCENEFYKISCPKSCNMCTAC